MLRTAAAALFLLATMGAGTAAARPLAPSVCTQAIAAAEAEHAIPRGLLMAIGFGEGGRAVEGWNTVWPWTVNVEGSGSFLPDKQRALAFVRERLLEGKRSIDVGCMQVNLRWHPDAFSSLEEAFDPRANVRYAARFLVALRQEIPLPGLEGWMEAVGRYHSATEFFASRYRNHVAGHWARLQAPEILLALADPGDPSPTMTATVAAEAGDASYRATDGRGERETMPVIPARFGGMAIVGLTRVGPIAAPATAAMPVAAAVPLPVPNPSGARPRLQPAAAERGATRRPLDGPGLSFSERLERDTAERIAGGPQRMTLRDYRR